MALREVTVEGSFGALGLHALSCLFGASLTGLIWLVLRRAAAETMRVQVIAAAIACLPAAAMLATFNIGFFIYRPVGVRTATERGPGGVVMKRLPSGEFRIDRPGQPTFVVKMPSTQAIIRQRATSLITAEMVSWYFFFAAWASFYIAMSAAARMRTAEKKYQLTISAV